MEIVTIHYNTPDLLENLIKSIRVIGNYTIRVIDGSDTEDFMRITKAVCQKYECIELLQLGYNIHHGRGIDYALRSSRHDWMLLIDSDSQIKQGLLEALLWDKPYCGFGMQVDKYGMNCQHGILYLHPHFLLINVYHYNTNSAKFIHHGAPALQVMMCTPDEDKNVINEDYQQYFIRGGRGTVDRFGYQL